MSRRWSPVPDRSKADYAAARRRRALQTDYLLAQAEDREAREAEAREARKLKELQDETFSRWPPESRLSREWVESFDLPTLKTYVRLSELETAEALARKLGDEDLERQVRAAKVGAVLKFRAALERTREARGLPPAAPAAEDDHDDPDEVEEAEFGALQREMRERIRRGRR